jgi:hypothetical protein
MLSQIFNIYIRNQGFFRAQHGAYILYWQNLSFFDNIGMKLISQISLNSVSQYVHQRFQAVMVYTFVSPFYLK